MLTADMDWVISPSWQGCGFASEAAQAMLEWLRSNGVNRFTSHILPAICASIRVAQNQALQATLSRKDGEIRWESQSPPSEVADVRARQGAVDFALVQRDGQRARLLISLPSSGAPQYWLYADPSDTADWVSQLLIWIDEEVFTGGLSGSRARLNIAGDSYVITENYGWRLEGAAEHARLSAAAAAGPSGWHAGGLN
ncbi:N-acetyltransferase [Cryobacterium frigoriphilum]|uniref:N-acetyltransferase n=1 Tax=Cryobacterium frigoriphilum TaxID=1259150 RepID=A0A4R8ZZP0_9MICO|nr:GNAT family N-acetyltransferase [Cryobacterium frigoriphilum]TFD49600.1 N-acetyltransferase [Cryobacterium frigoriphilum]